MVAISTLDINVHVGHYFHVHIYVFTMFSIHTSGQCLVGCIHTVWCCHLPSVSTFLPTSSARSLRTIVAVHAGTVLVYYCMCAAFQVKISIFDLPDLHKRALWKKEKDEVLLQDRQGFESCSHERLLLPFIIKLLLTCKEA